MALVAASATLPHSDLAYRAMLRNLKVLSGLRHGRDSFALLVTGAGADAVAPHLQRLEPALRVEVAGGGRVLDMDAIRAKKGADLDAILITQVYHSLRSPADLAVMRDALEDEEGTLGFLWHRCLPDVRGRERRNGARQR